MLLTLLIPICLASASSNEFEAPFRVESKSGPIDVSYGHAMPLVHDWDGDAKPDLLVGQYAGGRLRIYSNLGEPREPRFESFSWFATEEGRASVPIS